MAENARPKAYSYIRMSTALQLKGHSLERQIETARRFAAKHGLELDNEFSLHDIGVSAFRGKNAATGNLGKLLSAIEDGRIASGSWLLIESLDRLSRQDVYAAFGLFSQIINAGIVVATTAGDGQIYMRAATDGGQIWMLLGEMVRSNDESKKKNFRGLANWSAKRRGIRSKKLTAMCPGWLSLNAEKTAFEIIEGHRAVVERIFNDSLAGIGISVTTRRLNDENIPTFTNSDGWHESSVNKILNNRGVFGEFQPHRRDENNKSVPEGPPIADYFPVIISKDTFYAAQAQRRQRSTHGRGRKGVTFANLFAGMLTCHYCGRSVHYENKGDGPKGGKYLICEGARRNMGCEKTRWRYDSFEMSVLAFVEELDLGALYATGENAKARNVITTRIAAIDGETQSSKQAQAGLLSLLSQPGMSDITIVGDELRKHQTRIASLEGERIDLTLRLQIMSDTARQYYDSRDNVQALLARLKSGPSADPYKERSQIAARLRALIEVIELAPAGSIPTHKRDYDQLLRFAKKLDDSILTDIITANQNSLGMTDSFPYFVVKLRDGRFRQVIPDKADPMQLHEMTVQFYEKSTFVKDFGEHIGRIEVDIN